METYDSYVSYPSLPLLTYLPILATHQHSLNTHLDTQEKECGRLPPQDWKAKERPCPFSLHHFLDEHFSRPTVLCPEDNKSKKVN